MKISGWLKPKQRDPELRILEKAESRYHNIYIIEQGNKREMWFRGNQEFFLQSRVDLDHPDSLDLVYSKMMLAAFLFNPAPKRLLMVGLGGAAFSNFLRARFPRLHIDVVEVDGKVIALCEKYFFLEEAENYRVYQEDARVFIKNHQGAVPYDIVVLDAFKSESIPFHLKTREFYLEIRNLLAPDGLVASNLYGQSNVFKPGDRKTFCSVFRHIYCFRDDAEVATVSIATNERRLRTRKDLFLAAEAFDGPLSFSMGPLPALYRPGEFVDENAASFEDDFTTADFLKVAKRNNENGPQARRYSIKGSY